MEEERRQPTAQELAEYARKLAQLTARISQMTPAQREKYAEKIAQVKHRVSRLTPAMRQAYNDELVHLGLLDAQEGPSRPAPAVSPAEAYQTGLDDQGRADEEAARAAKPAQASAQQEKPQEEEEPQEEDAADVPVLRKKGRKGCLAVLLVALVLFGAVCGAGVWTFNEVDGHRGRNSVTTTVTISQGSSPLAIGSALQESGIIRSARAFQIYVRLTNAAASLQYGSFQLSSTMSYGEIVQALQVANDTRDTVTVTFPEGNTAVQYALRMEEAGLCSAQEFLDVANNADFSQFKFWSLRQEDPLQFMKCEGYLFPNTYEFFVGDDVYNMVEKLYAEFDAQFTEEMYARCEELNMTLTQLVTLASLVQEEAGNDQSKMVSAVFHNRLEQGMTLGSNVAWYKEIPDDNNYIYDTLAGPYGYGSWDAIPTEVGEAYDTYTHAGLPVGPVSNPGLVAIEAALWPEENCEYLYFQTDTLGNYHYATTLEEHNRITQELEAQGIRP